MGNEALETLVVMASEVIDAEATERGANGSETVAIDIRQTVAGIVDGRQIVLHAQAGPVARDFLAPLAAEARQAVAVGGNDDVALLSHDAEVPSV